MATLIDGQRVEVQGSGDNRYELARRGDVVSCTCPAWRKQAAPPEARTCKHLRAYLGDAAETARTGSAGPRLRVPERPKHAPPRRAEDEERRAERRAALQRAIARFPAAREEMARVYGLRLPKHLAYAIGFWLGLDRDERREAWAYLGNGPCGVGEWLEDGGHERHVSPGLDERLHYRYRRDPPEMVSIWSGNSDGGHWGLFYDDPAELPPLVAMNWARDSAETGSREPTLLLSLYEDIAGSEHDPWTEAEWPHRRAVLDWMEEVLPLEIAAHHEEGIARPPPRSSWLIGGMDPVIPGFVLPDDLTGYEANRARYEAYRASAPIVDTWIARARTELAQGSPGRALFLGRELHWADEDAHRAACTELLVGAYEALGRGALARIVEVHHAHRDLASVDVYEPVEPSALQRAVATRDVAAATAILATGGLSAEDLAGALGSLVLAVLDAALAHPEARALAERAADEHLAGAAENLAYAEAHPSLGELGEAQRAAALHLFARCGATGRAFTRAITSKDSVVRAAAIAHADLAWRSARGRGVLHLAARASAADVVAALLDRGADPRAKDDAGKTAYDAAREAWVDDPRGAGAVFDLLAARGGGPPRAPEAKPKAEWEPGVAVSHAKFGAGVVEAVEGSGEATKLAIRFGAEKKVLLAKFVTRG